jgi:hypothetical protein
LGEACSNYRRLEQVWLSDTILSVWFNNLANLDRIRNATQNSKREEPVLPQWAQPNVSRIAIGPRQATAVGIFSSAQSPAYRFYGTWHSLI